mmetsp:Transcript_37579/g.85573  ORF Transcript_37579/g.85573 Transcript_37579/m.85573 type:complete len:345 (-) Transcript_37579:2309-3343(-)
MRGLVRGDRDHQRRAALEGGDGLDEALAERLFPDHLRSPVLLKCGGQHLSGTRRGLVHEHRDRDRLLAALPLRAVLGTLPVAVDSVHDGLVLREQLFCEVDRRRERPADVAAQVEQNRLRTLFYPDGVDELEDLRGGVLGKHRDSQDAHPHVLLRCFARDIDDRRSDRPHVDHFPRDSHVAVHPPEARDSHRHLGANSPAQQRCSLVSRPANLSSHLHAADSLDRVTLLQAGPLCRGPRVRASDDDGVGGVHCHLDANPPELNARRLVELRDGRVLRRREEARVLVPEQLAHVSDALVGLIHVFVVPLAHKLLPCCLPVDAIERLVDVRLPEDLPRLGDRAGLL